MAHHSGALVESAAGSALLLLLLLSNKVAAKQRPWACSLEGGPLCSALPAPAPPAMTGAVQDGPEGLQGPAPARATSDEVIN